MSIKMNIPSYMKPLTNDMKVVEVNGSTVGECLNHLITQFPDIKKRLLALAACQCIIRKRIRNDKTAGNVHL